MKIRKSELSAALTALNRVTKKCAIRALECVQLSGGDCLTIQGTDLEQFLTVSLPIVCEGESIVNLKDLRKLLKGRGKTIDLILGKELTISDEKVSVSLPSFSSEDFPTFSERGELILSIDAEWINKDLPSALSAASEDETRHVLCGVYVEYSKDDASVNGFRLSATDGKRLHTIGSGVSLEAGTEAESFILPPAIITASKLKMKGRVRVYENDKTITFASEEIEYTIKKTEGTYPQYRQVIPDNRELEIEFNAEQFKELIKAIPRDEEENILNVIIGREETTVKHNSSGASGKVESKILRENDPEQIPFSFAINPDFLTDALEVFPDKVLLKIGDELTPLTFNAENRTVALMPMRS